jgi:hypothetical protein
VHRRAGDASAQVEVALAESAGVDVAPLGGRVGDVQGGAVGERVEALPLEVSGACVDHDDDQEQDDKGEADDDDADLAALVPSLPSHRRPPGSDRSGPSGSR